MDCPTPHWSITEKIPYNRISWMQRHLLNCGSFLPDYSGLCQVDTQNQPVQWHTDCNQGHWHGCNGYPIADTHLLSYSSLDFNKLPWAGQVPMLFSPIYVWDLTDSVMGRLCIVNNSQHEFISAMLCQASKASFHNTPRYSWLLLFSNTPFYYVPWGLNIN